MKTSSLSVNTIWNIIIIIKTSIVRKPEYKYIVRAGWLLQVADMVPLSHAMLAEMFTY